MYMNHNDVSNVNPNGTGTIPCPFGVDPLTGNSVAKVQLNL